MNEESRLIRSFVAGWGPIASGIGDDAAVLDVPAGEKLVVSTDASVERIHFRRADITPSEVGYRAAAAALSDLAAMAARPIGLLFSLVLPHSWRDAAESIGAGVGEAAGDSGCPIVGGNVSSGQELSITTTVLGACRTPLARSGAAPGDSLFVTGTLGGAAAAVAAWASGREPDAASRRAFVHPEPRIREAFWLGAHGATSAIDISDGLATDATHLAEASGMALTVDMDGIPVSSETSSEDAFTGGEDYELLVTAPALDAAEFLRLFGIPLTRIGSVAEGAAGVIVLKKGAPYAPRPGFDHLSVK